VSVSSNLIARPWALVATARPPRAWLVWVAASLVFIVTYVLVEGFPQDELYSAFSLASAITILVATLARRPRTMVPWLILAAGAFLMAAGEIGYTIVPGWDEFPAPPDAFYIAGYVAFCSALVVFERKVGGGVGAMLDAGILVIAGAMVLWTFAIEPIVEAQDQSPIALAIAVSYPLFDLALIGLLARGVMGSAVRGASLLLFAAGMMTYLVSDIAYSVESVTGTYVGGLIDAGWIAGYALWAAAALHPSMTQFVPDAHGTGELTLRRLLVISVAAVTPVAMAATGQLLYGHMHLVLTAVTGLAMFGLVVARLGAMMLAQRRLLDQRLVLERTLARQALEDPLTGLPNRRGFLEHLTQAVAGDRDHVAVLFLDLDDFKSVNDSLGHAAGDRLLAAVGERLRSVTRATDAVARLGGDEFAVLAEHCPSVESALAFADRVQRAVSAPVAVAGTTLLVRVSIGVALGGPDAADAHTLMRNADLAVYRAKSLGRARCELYEPGMYEDLLRGLAIREGLEDIVSRGELELRYQPIVDLVTGKTRSCEALLRWRHPTLGLLGPAEFLRPAEQAGAMPAIGRWVLFEACRAAARWAGAGHPEVGVNVNLAASQLRSLELDAEVRRALAQTGLPARSLTLEVTETVLDDAEDAARQLDRLRRLGVRISIDDFGTGYSSLARVADLPVTELKLDRSLVTHDGNMLQAVFQFGHRLGAHIVAEGVETPGQLSRMRELGCDSAQGYRLARPLTEAEATAFLARSEGTGLAPGLPSPVPVGM
jgi:diguanylate cyclase (GGDEF)-like protein